MPVAPELVPVVESAKSFPGARSLPISQLRTAVRDASITGAHVNTPLSAVTDRTIPGPAGQIPIRIYTPIGNAPFPVILYFHGGGFVVGDLDTQDPICRSLAHAATAVVVSVDYRLAPEHPFPAAVEDGWAALHWVAAQADELSANQALLSVAGDSAGGIIGAALALRARDENGPKLRAQINFYGFEYPSLPTPSSIEFQNGPIITEDDTHYYWSQYLRDADTNKANPYAVPASAENHTGLPPAFICTAECDPGRDRTEAYGEMLIAAGIDTTIRRYAGMTHAFLSWVAWLPTAQSAVKEAADWFNETVVR